MIICKFCYERKAEFTNGMCEKCMNEYESKGYFWPVLFLSIFFTAVMFIFVMAWSGA